MKSTPNPRSVSSSPIPTKPASAPLPVVPAATPPTLPTPTLADHTKAVQAIVENTASACERLNAFTAKVFRTRGGRIGSGMGGVIEALWGFFLNQILAEKGQTNIELAWMYGHEYNDFACIGCGCEWDPATRTGELLRVEVKSMVASADESKAHFDRLAKEPTETDLLAVFLWDWVPTPEATGAPAVRVSPQVKDHFIGKATDVARLRDTLHRARGGTFVEVGHCPDGCPQASCTHIGEPLNASRKRERLSGPKSARVSQSVSYAANFGGLVRMLKCSSPEARAAARAVCRESATAWEFLNFIHRNLRDEELNHYAKEDWVKVAHELQLRDIPADKSVLINRIRESGQDYRKLLRSLK